MNFYKRYPGDYLAKTRHLSLLEHGAYGQMLDWAYSTEQPLPADSESLYRICGARSPAECQAVERVLRAFWVLEAQGWVNPRATAEIAEAQPRITAARENGRRGGRARQFAAGVPRGTKPAGQGLDQPADSGPASVAPSAGQAPQKPEPDKSIPAAPDAAASRSAPDPGFDSPPPADRIFGFGLELLRGKGVAEKPARSSLGWLRKSLGDEAAIVLLERLQREDISDPVPWLMAACAARKRGAGQGMTRADAQRDYAQGVGHDGGF